MEIVRRKKALELGLKTYYTGMPCKYGHTGLRNTRDGKCKICASVEKKGEAESKQLSLEILRVREETYIHNNQLKLKEYDSMFDRAKYNRDKYRAQNIKKFLDSANKKHNYFYDYSKVQYVNMHTPVIIICPHHGEFVETPTAHKRGTRCERCVIEEMRDTVKNGAVEKQEYMPSWENLQLAKLHPTKGVYVE